MSKIIIGIDPDVDKSGVAIINTELKTLELKNLVFFDLFEWLNSMWLHQPKVYIEAGHLNKSNWHLPRECSKQMAAMIGNKTGANHEVARKIVEMCEFIGLNYVEIKPTQTKLDAKTFKNITKYEKRTNQEQRDAAMLIFGRNY